MLYYNCSKEGTVEVRYVLELNINKFNELQGDMTDIDMACKLGVSRTQLWRIKNKKSSVGEKFIAAFMRQYPNLKVEDYFFTNGVAFQEHNINKKS